MEEISSAVEVRHRMGTFISFQPEATAQRRNSSTRIRHHHQQTYRNSSYSNMLTARSSGGKKRQQRQQQEIGDNGMLPDIEPFIVTLCREKRWTEVIQRSHTHPEEAIPRCATRATNKYDPHAMKRVGVGLNFNHSSDYIHQAAMINTSPSTSVDGEQEERIFQETPLGIACASPEIHTYEVHAAIQALVKANPSQIVASQLISGHTPLRDALRNPRLTTNVLKVLIGAEESPTANVSSENDLTASFFFKTALRKTDRNGMHPLDHLIIAVQLGSHPHALDVLKEVVQNSDGISVKSGSASSGSSSSGRSTTSPLIRLLSLGTSFGSKGADFEPRPSSRVLLSGGEKNNQNRLENILQATTYLLDRNPSLINWCSVITGCSPLHVALRNYGDYAPLIREFVSRDQSGTIMTLKNHFGDLPIHVACSVGVPMEVLRLILERTLSASKRHNKEDGSRPDSHVWSVNNSGYTPIDLEWVRHIESGKSFYSARSFYPLEPTGVRKHCFKQDEYYQALLRDSVDQVVQQSSHSASSLKSHSASSLKDSSNYDVASREEDAKSTFGVLIDRIKLILSSAALRSIPADPRASLLHNASRLTCPAGPNLPLPLLELILWMHPEQLTKADPSGKLPIHYVMMQGSKVDSTSSNLQSGKVWEQFVLRLLADAPETAKMKDVDCRLPLHHLVSDFSTTGLDSQATHGSRQNVVEKLLHLHPESIDAQDPITKLDPFMLSATSRHAPLDLIFLLLRNSPSRCTNSRNTKTTTKGDS